jgi:hypothetical protein
MIEYNEIVKIKKTGEVGVIREGYCTPEGDMFWIDIDNQSFHENGVPNYELEWLGVN